MRLTRREKVLAAVVLLIIMSGLVYTFVYTPQREKIAELELSIQTTEAEINTIRTESAPGSKLREDYKIFNARIASLTERFFPEIIQSRIIVLLDEIITQTGIDAFTISFTRPAPATIQAPAPAVEERTTLHHLADEFTGTDAVNENNRSPDPAGEQAPLKSVRVAMQIQGEYSQILSLIREIQNYQFNILIEDISLAGGNLDETISGSISLNFFALPKLHAQDIDFFKWDFENDFGRHNPFALSGDIAPPGEAPPREGESDFVMSIKPITADSPTVVMGRAGVAETGTYVFGDNAGFENVQFTVFKKNGNYYYKYRTEREAFPADFESGVRFTPVGNEIVLTIFCNPRTHAQDQNGINLTLNNHTGSRLIMQIRNEDKSRPRVNIVEKEGRITVRR